MASAVGVLRDQWGVSCDRLLQRLEGLTDEEYRWEPVGGCWNVRPDARSPSGWTVDYPEVAPDPPPVTTIAWRMLHISDGNTIYWEHAFGPGVRNFLDRSSISHRVSVRSRPRSQNSTIRPSTTCDRRT